MREIKFRVWDGYEMYDDGYYIAQDGSLNERNPSGDTQSCWCNDVGPATASQDSVKILQYTGLLDMNGEEIYEGDIVQYWEYSTDEGWRVSAIEFINDYGSDGFRMTGFVSQTYFYPEGWEVIGNIYENPELLSHPRHIVPEK